MYGSGSVGASGAHEPQSGTVDTAKNEAGEVVGSAKDEAGRVVDTAKTEAASVAREAKTQVKDLYSQTQRELKEQAAVQQQRVADGLRSVGDELASMADKSETPGVAADLVSQVSARLSGAATWIGDRDPGSLLSEVKSYARRKPGVFIAVAALAGLAAGRLTRALADQAADEKSASTDFTTTGYGTTGTAGVAPGTVGATTVPPVPPIPGEFGADPVGSPAASTPVYDQIRGTGPGEGSADVRSDSV
jgi:vacuolar-type H+-ATPase subunit H